MRTIQKVRQSKSKKKSSKLTSSYHIDLEIVAIKGTSITRTYLLDVKHDTHKTTDLRKAVIFARGQLLQEAKKNGYNMLWLERYLSFMFLSRLQCVTAAP